MLRMETVAKKKDLEISLNDITILFIGFFVSRVSILNELTPFGIAFLGTYISMKNGSLALLISTVLGMFTIHGFSGLPYYIIAIACYYVFKNILKEKKYTLFKSSLILSQIFLIIKLLTFILFEKVLLYNIFVIGFESVLVFTLSYIFSFSLPLEKISKNKINREKFICTFITMALVLSGFNNIEIFNISIKNILSIIFVIYLSYSSGILVGATSGVMIGMVAYISNTEMPFIIALFAVGGLLSGLFRDLGRSGSILGFVLGNGIISFYINSLGTSFLDYRELFMASIIFLAASKFIKVDLEDYFIENTHIKKHYEDKKLEIATKRLNEMESLFNNLQEVLNRSIDEEVEYPSFEVYNLIDDVSKKTCEGCKNIEKCWGSEYYNTYYNILDLINKIENNYQAEELFIDIDDCNNKEDLIENIIETFLSFKKNRSFNMKLLEHRKLLAEQIGNIGRIIGGMGMEFYSTPIFNEELEEIILKELKNKKMNVENLSVVELERDDIEVLVEMDSDIESVGMIEEVKKEVSKNLGFPLSADYKVGNLNSQNKVFKLVRKKRFNALTNISNEPNPEEEVCGDSYTFGERASIQFSAISDGMGIGQKAHKESSIAIELLEKLMDINMDKDLIIKTLNSVLRIKSTEEIFTTLDVSFIDLYTGKLQIIKNGSPATFIKRGKEVRVINCNSLPIGILEDVDLNIYEEELQDGDIVIMMSDGLIESNRNVEDQEKWMKGLIESIDSLNPQTIADQILSSAKLIGKDNEQDDMTIIATKVWKNI